MNSKVIQSGQGAYLIIDGKEYLNLCSSHYLGLGVHPRVKKAVKDAVEKYGVGTGYRTLAGNHILHEELEEALAKFKGAEAAVIFSGGYLTNLAAIQTVLGKEDVVISDELNHASIIDAIRLSGVKNKLIYKHRDIECLKGLISQIPRISPKPQKIMIVTDGVFSMDGDLAPLPELLKIAREIRAILMVDDAHGEGVLGRGGRGIVDHFNLHNQIDIEVGTLSKAFSAIGGFITGKKELIDVYKTKARQMLFSNALTIPDAAAALEGVRILTESDELVKKLWENTKFLKSELKRASFNIGNSETPITPIMLGDEELAIKFAEALFAEGIFATAIKFPMVAKGAARIRLIPSASHSKKDLEAALSSLIKIAKSLKII